MKLPRLFIILLALCKKFDGFPDEEGTYPRIAMKMLLKYGVCPESFWLYRNSWSRKWADKGCGYLPYAYIQKYCQDSWSATDLIENPKAFVKKLARNRVGPRLSNKKNT